MRAPNTLSLSRHAELRDWRSARDADLQMGGKSMVVGFIVIARHLLPSLLLVLEIPASVRSAVL